MSLAWARRNCARAPTSGPPSASARLRTTLPLQPAARSEPAPARLLCRLHAVCATAGASGGVAAPRNSQPALSRARAAKSGAAPAPGWAAHHAALRDLLATPGATPAAAAELALAARAAGAPVAARVEALAWAAATGGAVSPAALAAPDQWRFLDEVALRGSITDALTAAALLPRRGACHNRLVWAFCRAGSLQSALAVHAHMQEHGPPPTLATYRVLLLAAGRGRTRRPGLAVSLLRQLRSQGLQLDARTANVLLNTLASAPAAAVRAYDALVQSRAALDVISYNTLLKAAAAPEGGLSRNARVALARRAMVDMARAMVPPDSATLASAVAVLGSAGQVDEAFQVWTDLRAGGVAPCERGWTALLCACRTAGQFERCLAFFQAMRAARAGVRPGRHHWNVVIDAAVQAGLPERAFALAEEMRRANVLPDKVTRNTLLRATAAAHGLEAAFEAAAAGPRDLVTWTLLIDLCADACDAPRAVATLAALRGAGLEPDVITWTAVMKAHAAAGDVGAALETYHEMRAQAVRPTQATFLVLLRACRAKQDVERATIIYREMRRAGMRPQDGAFRALLGSWVDAALERGTGGGAQALTQGASTLPGCLFSPGYTSVGPDGARSADGATLDLHGLSAAEARAAMLCQLRLLRDADAAGAPLPQADMLIITGRGRNSVRGVPVLRDEAVRLCSELRLRCEEDGDNPGRMRISVDTLRAWLARQQGGGGSQAAAAGGAT